MAPHRGIPHARSHILGEGAFLEEQSATGIEQKDMDDPVHQGRVGMDFSAWSEADDFALFVHDLQLLFRILHGITRRSTHAQLGIRNRGLSYCGKASIFCEH
jgi:hypothetical protein